LNHKHQPELIAAAKAAHSQKLGLWSECGEDKTAGCLVKGNLEPLDKEDRWFCSEQEAMAAGFKRARE